MNHATYHSRDLQVTLTPKGKFSGHGVSSPEFAACGDLSGGRKKTEGRIWSASQVESCLSSPTFHLAMSL
jgi:hypothetical protein